METSVRQSGIDVIGDIPWGTHFCQFYNTEADLAETLVPYFEAGLRAGEACLWVTGRKLEAQKAEALMIDAVPAFKDAISSGQMEIVSISDWYVPGDVFDPSTVLQGWIDKEASARNKGFNGLRLTGDTVWVERSGWTSFMEYERQVNASFRRHNLVALCTYCLDNCSASDVIDVCCQHQFALARREGAWELLESSSLKIAKDSLMRLNTELESRVESRTAELRSALQARDEFLAMLGHELRNPLAPIRASADIIRTLTPADSPISASTDILSRQVGHLTHLVNDLLDVARVTKGQIQLDLHEIALADVIAAAVEQTRPIIDQHLHALSVTLPARTVRVRADANRLAQVFGNLLHNAAKYTPDGGLVSIAARAVGEQVEIVVRDNGTGIPEGMLDAIFGLFSQLPRSLARSEGGLGIGLTLAKRIVDMHDGTIVAHSDGPNTGTEIVVRLAQAQAAPRSAPTLLDPGFAPAAAKCRILLVDDNEDAREAMGALLQIHGHEVLFACDGKSALAAAAAFGPAIVILDIGLPDMDGYEVARRLRASPHGASARLIALTGYGQSGDIAAATAAGFDAHILKPAQMDNVLAEIAAFSAR
ncbi:MAG TPA: MEDS domain-containing protein [Telluria sp.]|jgi:signal transduction histidine kinase